MLTLTLCRRRVPLWLPLILGRLVCTRREGLLLLLPLLLMLTFPLLFILVGLPMSGSIPNDGGRCNDGRRVIASRWTAPYKF